MKILQIHKYYSFQRGGGSVSAFFETKKLLEERGHQVIIFSMQDKTNEKSPYSKYFISHFDINQTKNFREKIKLGIRSIYNREAKKKLEILLQKEKPDIAHIHNIYHYITPSIIDSLKKYHIPIVFKLSDYKIVCPNYKLFTQGHICQKCLQGRYYNTFIHKCLKDSYAISFVAMLEAYFHKWKKTYTKVNRFLAPSQFMIDIVSSAGIPSKKISLLRNVLNFSQFEADFEKRNYFAYVGRISEEKGLDILLKAVAFLKNNQQLFNHKLLIVGKGPSEKKLHQLAQKLNITDVVKFKGFLAKNTRDWKNIFQKARFTVLPSIWYDNSPVAISESMAFGTPVIVSNLGGTPEMIENEKSGLIFEARDKIDLAEKILKLISNPQKAKEMGKKAFQRVHKINNEELYYKKLFQIYKEVIKENENKKI